MNSETRTPASASAGADLRQLAALGDDVQAALGGELLAPLRDQAAVGGTHPAGDGDHCRGRRQLQVHARLQGVAEQLDVALLDVPAVLPQVQGDAVGPGLLGHQGGLNRLRVTGTAGLANGRDVVDVDPEEDLADGFMRHGCLLMRVHSRTDSFPEVPLQC